MFTSCSACPERKRKPMEAHALPVKVCLLLACALGLTLVYPVAAASQTAGQAQQPEKEKKQETKEEPKGGTGIFSGFGRLSGTSKTEEKQTTVAAGAKGAKPGGQADAAVLRHIPQGFGGQVAISHLDPLPEEMTAFL